MAQLTKAQLAEELAGARHNLDELRTVRARLEAELAELKAKLEALQAKTPAVPPAPQITTRVGNPRLTYEFDPAIPGDYARAAALARANCGIVRRASA